MWRLLWVVLLAIGCTQSPEARIQTVCNAFCDCTSAAGLPSAIQECITTECTPAVMAVSDDCLQCVFDHEGTCSALEDDCETLCFMQQTN